MKHLIFITILCLATGLAQAQKRYVQPIDKEVTTIVVKDDATATIVIDTSSWVETQRLIDNDIVLYANGTLQVGNLQEELCIHVDSRRLRKIHLDDASSVKLQVGRQRIERLAIEASGLSQLSASGDTLRCKELSLAVSEEAQLNFGTTTLLTDRLSCSLVDGSTALFGSIVADEATFNVNDIASLNIMTKSHIKSLTANCANEASANLGKTSGNKFIINAHDVSYVTLGGNWILGTAFNYDEGRAVFKGTADNFTENGWNVLDDKNTKKAARKTYSVSDRGRINLAFGLSNWGDKPLNGLSYPVLEDAVYQLTFFSRFFSIDLEYAWLMTPHWRLGTGVGLMNNRFVFSNYSVNFNETTNGLYSDPTGYESTLLRVKAVFLSYFVEYRTRTQGFSADLTLMLGHNYTNKRTGLYQVYASGTRNYDLYNHSIESILNPFRLDVRASLGGDRLRYFVQMSTQPLFVNNSQKVYPVETGFMIKF